MYAERSRHLEQQTLPQPPERGSGAAAVAILVAGAGWVHVLAVQDHWAHPHLAGFFIAVTVLQLGWAACLVASNPPARLLWAGLVGNAGLVLLWGTSRTTGLSFVPDLSREPVGSADLAASSLEVFAVIGLALMLSRTTGRLSTSAARAMVRVTAVVTFLLVVTAGASSTSHHHDQDHLHDRASMPFNPVGEYPGGEHAAR